MACFRRWYMCGRRLVFVSDVAIGHFQHPELSLLEAGANAGGMFGFIATIFVCPGMTAIAVAGFVRACLVHEKSLNA